MTELEYDAWLEGQSVIFSAKLFGAPVTTTATCTDVLTGNPCDETASRRLLQGVEGVEYTSTSEVEPAAMTYVQQSAEAAGTEVLTQEEMSRAVEEEVVVETAALVGKSIQDVRANIKIVTRTPTASPTQEPTAGPTSGPTTAEPTAGPTFAPSLAPTLEPTRNPTEEGVTFAPTTTAPTYQGQTNSPTAAPAPTVGSPTRVEFSSANRLVPSLVTFVSFFFLQHC
jgi:hypothetical protein